jgi:hypothetical protein
MSDLANPTGAVIQLDSLRPRFEFKIPESERTLPGDPSVVVLREITVAEEQQASQAASGQGIKYVYEAVKYSLVEADGKPIGWADGGKERFLEGCGARVRALLIRAYDSLHMPKEQTATDFLATRRLIA